MDRQKEILKVFNSDTSIILSKQDIKTKGGISYYHNTDKHLGDTLTRMVKNGSLIRVSRGNYKLGSGNKMVVQPKNQTSLFSKESFQESIAGAVISDCNNYRYKLWRVWDSKLPKVMFIMLNPSTADSSKDDPTIRRCISFAKSWGFGGIYVGNLFAYRSTSPKGLLETDNPFGDFNNIHQTEMSEICELVVCAWGNSPILKKLNYKPEFDNIKKSMHYIELSQDGTPKHPLYLKGNLMPIKYD